MQAEVVFAGMDPGILAIDPGLRNADHNVSREAPEAKAADVLQVCSSKFFKNLSC